MKTGTSGSKRVSTLTWFVNSHEDWACLTSAVERGDYEGLQELQLKGTAWGSTDLAIMDRSAKTFGALHTGCPHLKRLGIIRDVADGEWETPVLDSLGVMKNLTDLSITIMKKASTAEWGGGDGSQDSNGSQDSEQSSESEDLVAFEYIVPACIAELVNLEFLTIKSLTDSDYPRDDVLVFIGDEFGDLVNLHLLRVRGFRWIGARWLNKTERMPLLDVDGAEVEV